MAMMPISSLLGHRLAGRISEREATVSRFLAAEQDRIIGACLDMARAFDRGGRLIVLGSGSAEADAHRIAIEFMHPVRSASRPLPAVALTRGRDDAARLDALAGPHDLALGLSHAGWDFGLEAFSTRADQLGLLGVACCAGTSRRSRSLVHSLDHALIVPTDDPFVAQEVQGTIGHLMAELIHVFLERLEWGEDSCTTCGDAAFTGRVIALSKGVVTIETRGFTEEVAVDLIDHVAVDDLLLCHAGVALQKLAPAALHAAGGTPTLQPPFPGSEDGGLDAARVVARTAILRAGGEVSALRRQIDRAALERCAASVRERLERGGRVIVLGAARSSIEASDAAADFVACGWPATSLPPDRAVAGAGGTSLAERLEALAADGDIAVGMIADGASPEVSDALESARDGELLTCAITGAEVGGLARVDHLFTVAAVSRDRIQEVQATIRHLLLEAIGAPIGGARAEAARLTGAAR